MTFAELKTLVETMQNLPCVMSQLEEVQVRSFYLSKGCDEMYNFFPSGTKDELQWKNYRLDSPPLKSDGVNNSQMTQVKCVTASSPSN